MLPEGIKETPWDYPCLEMKTYEVSQPSPEVYNFIAAHNGHYTLKIDPLYSSKEFIKLGFYYCDTLIEPFCNEDRFKAYASEDIALIPVVKIDEVSAMLKNCFIYSRFYRDFNIDNSLAEKRYYQWLLQLINLGTVFVFTYKNDPAGFVACSNNRLVLHALHENYRGQGLAKFFWTLICEKLFQSGFSEITSSISVANMSVVNLYSSLGFKFRNAQDVYHLLKRDYENIS